MVLEPKFADYGTINSTGDAQPQRNSPNAFLSPDSIITTLPPLDDEESPNTSKGTAMTQGNNVLKISSAFKSYKNRKASSLPSIMNDFELRSVNTESSVASQSEGDLYQRQPLLPAPAKGDRWGQGNRPESRQQYYSASAEDDDDDALDNHESNGVIKISMPPPIREEPRFPQERWKTVIAAIVLFFSFLLTLTALAIVHEKVPDRNVVDPLPDVFLSNVPEMIWGLSVSEYMIIICVASTLIVSVLHKHRFIVFRRLFLILALLYLYRAITMFVTVLPVPSKTYYCSPKTNATSIYEVTKRVIVLFSGMGLSINGKHTYCGDYMYSGHTVILVISCLFISEYTPKKLYLVHWLYYLMALVGVIMLQLGHGHYTLDVIVAYYITTRIFWTYHTLANNSFLKQHSPNNYLGREWWYCLFLYFEGNVTGPIPRQWPNWPLPWPKRCQSKSRES
ncbi:phosphatidylcholine:ceramide cholinephosphotransferase 2-like isoform X2 [Photinus pyralis]|uniref:Sphingomyelin synthase-like domain-containing protein n=2 Tax=Photinus pyralis TaxID=7054 RepID=A0A1Y1N5L3_PHOPY|nr:phosphatidylcholine:ceramide cholinephosphotransferase 2-like isoform X2 [Photinus pyralis]XP_031357341.1 phosphatidylcholine:ceramide cholinephosphotransferase 2-like isoform X2 [Photinus pyralis]XP_031357343.1 phosphatidylcholine:ceramide cholinephosphotransferase 2-like isoform X2 [Photinus pyralis]XP_031357344.1 phosphatidylcholine:ceramide cholinephosphotransferase 2-like isoform X2 [Photinus pyralis]XP_031357345.1 phosphatidylcholine:ceramide cholinephosphotransferase 2-like isoform X2